MVSYDTSGGAEFVKADLHLHTPDSYDYQDDVEPEEMIEAFEEEKLELVAVTDHNTTGFYEELAEAAEDSSVTVLPGVEITTGNSGENQIHMTAIFPPEQADDVDNFLYEVGIDDSEPQDEISGATIPEVCRTVREFSGLPILAHIDEAAGALAELSRNRTWEEVFDEDRVAALEIVSPDTRDEFTDRDFAFVRSSDAHSLSELGRGYTYLKVDEPSFEGLRTALADPESRVAIEREVNNHASVDGLYVENGFLHNRTLQFNKNLNCLIGGKGTGKSSVLEHIRYALDSDPRGEDIQQEYEELIEYTLSPNGEVNVFITGNNGDQYRISRQYGENPEIERIVEDGENSPVHIPIDEFRKEFFDVEIHSQRELLRLARDQGDQLGLLDLYFDTDDEKQRRDAIKSSIGEQSRKIADLEEEVNELERDKHRYETLREQVNVMKERGVDDRIEDDEEWGQERSELSRLREDMNELEEIANNLSLSDSVNEIDFDTGPNAELLSRADSVISGLIDDLEEFETEIIQRVTEAKEEIDDIWSQWDEANQDRQDEYSELADEIQEEMDVDIDEFFDKQAEMRELEGVGEQLSKKKDELREARQEKERLFEELAEARDGLTQIRREGIQELDDHLENVHVSLDAQANRSEYTDWVNRVLQGSEVYTSDKERVCQTFTPRELAQIVRNRQTDRLENEADLTPTAAENFVTHEDLRERLVELELLELKDRPVIELQDSGERKELSEISDGQQCTALLSIVLIRRDVPLIIDQPEDMLDNKFIVSDVVDLIRSIKHDRQIISATHNANIPVLGDAEQIIVMRSNATNGFYRKCGSIDDEVTKTLTQNILEGGERAFERRDEMYRKVV